MATTLEESRRFKNSYKLGSARVHSSATGDLGPTPFRGQDASVPSFGAKFAQILLEEPERKRRAALQDEFVQLAREESHLRLAKLRSETNKPGEATTNITVPTGQGYPNEGQVLTVPVSKAAAVIRGFQAPETTPKKTVTYPQGHPLAGQTFRVDEEDFGAANKTVGNVAPTTDDGKITLPFDMPGAPLPEGVEGPVHPRVVAGEPVDPAAARIAATLAGQDATTARANERNALRERLAGQVKDSVRRHTAAAKRLAEIDEERERQVRTATVEYKGVIQNLMLQAQGEGVAPAIAPSDTLVSGEVPGDPGGRPERKAGFFDTGNLFTLGKRDPKKDARFKLGLGQGSFMGGKKAQAQLKEATGALMDRFIEKRMSEYDKVHADERRQLQSILDRESGLIEARAGELEQFFPNESQSSVVPGVTPSFAEQVLKSLESLP